MKGSVLCSLLKFLILLHQILYNNITFTFRSNWRTIDIPWSVFSKDLNNSLIWSKGYTEISLLFSTKNETNLCSQIHLHKWIERGGSGVIKSISQLPIIDHWYSHSHGIAQWLDDWMILIWWQSLRNDLYL